MNAFAAAAFEMRDDLQDPVSHVRHRTNGITLHCAEAGPEDGPLVILLHGFPEFWWGWRKQIGPLAQAGLRVCAPDQRGYNLSDKPEGVKAYDLDTLARDVIGLADAHGRTRVHLVGHDWGGLVAWWTASRHPDRIERLAILNAPHPAIVGRYMRRHPTQMIQSLYAGFFQLPRLPETALAARDFTFLRQSLAGTSRRKTFSDDDLRRYQEAWSQPGALTAMLNWYRGLRLKPPMAKPRVDAPTLVIWGLRDPFLQEGLAQESLALCRDGRFLPFRTATHWVHLEEADQVNSALIEFLTSP
jgi:epoxide hydrolase 4